MSDNGCVTALRQIAVLCGCVLAVMSVALSVQASLWMDFEPSEASPEAEVFASTIGQDAATGALADLSPDNVVVLYLGADEAEVEGPQDPAAIRLGELEIDEDGHGQLTFMVPDLAPGAYVAYLHCQDCSFDAEGLTFAEAGLFEVSAADLPVTGPMNLAVLAIGAAVLLAGGAIALASKRPDTP